MVVVMNLLAHYPVHPSHIWPERCDWESIARAEYVGSFPVTGENQDQRTECVRKTLLEMKNVTKTRPVLLAVSLSGIKVCSNTGESILMAHALKRISYATCHPEFCQFSFLAREPKTSTNIQHCHVFLTKSAQEAAELNSIVGSAFNVAYACQRQSQVIYQPTFNELIRHQMEQQRERLEELSLQQEETLARRLCLIATPTAERRLEERHQKRQKEQEEFERRILQGKERTSWAKKVFEQNTHSQQSDSRTSSSAHPKSINNEGVLRQNLGFSDACQETSEPYPLSKQKNSFSSSECLLQQKVSAGATEEPYLCPIPCCQDILPTSTSGAELEFQVCHHMVNERRASRDDLFQSRNVMGQSPNNLPGRPTSSGPSMDQVRPKTASPILPVTEGPTRSRPLSGKYQNDEAVPRPSRDCSHDSEGRDIYQGPPTPIRHDSLRKMTSSQGTLYDELQDAAWYQPGVPREVALEILSQQDIGSFIIRDSTTHPGCYALSVKVPRYDNPSGISHYLITRTAKGSFKIKGLEKEWPTLTSLVTHHTVMRELLPCLLHVLRPLNTSASKDLDKDGSNY